jgi:hypothetical protein
MQAVYAAKSRVTNMMRDKAMRRSDHFAAAASAAAQGVSDEELERIARDGDRGSDSR